MKERASEQSIGSHVETTCKDYSPGHCPEAERAASYAVKKTFAIMGVDVDDPKEVSEFQEGLRFGQKLNSLANKGFLGIFAALTAILVAYIISLFTK